MVDIHHITGLKIGLIVGIIIIVFIFAFSIKINSVTVNIGNIGLPEKAIEELRKILGR